jgi:hypothetical protein
LSGVSSEIRKRAQEATKGVHDRTDLPARGGLTFAPLKEIAGMRQMERQLLVRDAASDTRSAKATARIAMANVDQSSKELAFAANAVKHWISPQDLWTGNSRKRSEAVDRRHHWRGAGKGADIEEVATNDGGQEPPDRGTWSPPLDQVEGKLFDHRIQR